MGTLKPLSAFAPRGRRFAGRALVAARDAAVMRTRLEAFARPVTFARSPAPRD